MQLAGGLVCTVFVSVQHQACCSLEPLSSVKRGGGGAREHLLSPKLTEHRLFARFIPSQFTVLLNPHMGGFPRYCVHPAPTGHMASARQLQATARASMPFSIGLPKIWQHSGVSVLPGTRRTMCWLFVEEVVAAGGCVTSDGPWRKESGERRADKVF